MGFEQRVSALRRDHGMTQDELAARLGVTARAVGAWEHGRARPRLDKLEELAGVLGVSSYYLLTGEQQPDDAPADIWPRGRREAAGRSGKVPVRRLGKTHAGEPSEAFEEDDRVEVPASVAAAHPSAFLLEVEGDCMSRAYPEGCLVLVDPRLDPWPGCAVVAETEPGKTVLRRYSRGGSTLMLSADSWRDGYEDMIWQGGDIAEVRLVGVVVWFQAAYEESGF